MATSPSWFKLIRRKFVKKSPRDIIVVYSNTSPNSQEETLERVPTSSTSQNTNTLLTKQDIAAIRIQALFRGHLARRAFGALRSLVKLQALVRGVLVRKQSRIALHCMHALVRLQVSVRTRQLLRAGSHDRLTLPNRLY